MIDSSHSSPATRIDRLVTMPPMAMTATSVVPPPMSTTMLPTGSAFPEREERAVDVRGRDLVSGLPRTVRMTSSEIREAMAEPVQQVVDAVKHTLERTPPELAADIVDRGIILAGGGALLRGMDRLLAEETGMPVSLADDPLAAVVMGTGRALEELETLRNVLIVSRRS